MIKLNITWRRFSYIPEEFTQLDGGSLMSKDEDLLNWLMADYTGNIAAESRQYLSPRDAVRDQSDKTAHYYMHAAFYTLSETADDRQLNSNHCWTNCLRPTSIRGGAYDHHKKASAPNSRFIGFVVSRVSIPDRSQPNNLLITATVADTHGSYVSLNINMPSNPLYLSEDTVSITSPNEPLALAATLYPDAMAEHYDNIGYGQYLSTDYLR